MSLRHIVLFAGIWSGLPAAAHVADADADRACARLVDVAQARQLAGPGKRGEYRCEYQDEAPERFVFALRWHGDGLPAVGSNLVGYYLVDAVSGDIHEWDAGEERRGDTLTTAAADTCPHADATSPGPPSRHPQEHCMP